MYRWFVGLSPDDRSSIPHGSEDAAGKNSESAQQQQHQQNDDDQAQASAAIITGPIEWPAAYSAEATEQGYYENNEDDCSNRHFNLRMFVIQSDFFESGPQSSITEPANGLRRTALW